MKWFQLLVVVIVIAAAAWWFTSQRSSTTTPETTEKFATELIVVRTPIAEGVVSSPITLSGEARGYWFFEASAPVVVVDWDGRIIGESYVTAQGDWMTEDFVPFTGTIEYDLPVDSYSASGTVIFQRDNPSGLPENDATFEVPVLLQ